MSDTEDIKSAINASSGADTSRIRDELLEKRWQDWDRQIAADSDAGRLDFLIEKAGSPQAKGTPKDFGRTG